MTKHVTQFVFEKNSQYGVDFTGTVYDVDDETKSKIYFLNNDSDDMFEVSKRALTLKKINNFDPTLNISKSDIKLCNAVRRHAVLICYFQHRGYVSKTVDYRYFIKLKKTPEGMYFKSVIQHFLEYNNEIIPIPYHPFLILTEYLIYAYIDMFFIEPKFFGCGDYLTYEVYNRFNEIKDQLDVVTKENILKLLVFNKLTE